MSNRMWVHRIPEYVRSPAAVAMLMDPTVSLRRTPDADAPKRIRMIPMPVLPSTSTLRGAAGMLSCALLAVAETLIVRPAARSR